MVFLIALPTLFAMLTLAAHFLRNGQLPMVLICLTAPFLLLIRRLAAVRIVQGLLLIGALEWIRTLLEIAAQRRDEGRPYLRMAIILGSVAAFTAIAALLHFLPPMRRRCCRNQDVLNIQTNQPAMRSAS